MTAPFGAGLRGAAAAEAVPGGDTSVMATPTATDVAARRASRFLFQSLTSNQPFTLNVLAVTGS